MMMQDKVVLITGAGRGIGRAMAIMMAQHGAKVVVNDLGAGVGGEPSQAASNIAASGRINNATARWNKRIMTLPHGSVTTSEV